MPTVKALTNDSGGTAPCSRVSKMAGAKTVKFSQEDLDMIEAASRYFDWVQESDLLRTAIRVGLESLREDPSPLGKRPLDPSMFRVHHGDPKADTPGVTKLANELRAERPVSSPEDETVREPGGKSTRKDGTTRRRSAHKAPKRDAGPDTPEERREREGR